ADGAPSARSALSPELNAIRRRLLGSADAYRTLGEAIIALQALAPELVASERRVSEQLQQVLGQLLERRTQKIQLLERGATQATEEDQTRYFRVASPPERHATTRPPDPPRAVLSSYGAHSDESKTRPPEA